MLIEAAIGKFIVTARNDSANAVTITSEKYETMVSLLDSIELVGGALGEDQAFHADDIEAFNLFGRPHFRIAISRAQLLRYFEYEILNFLDYSSLTKMRNYPK